MSAKITEITVEPYVIVHGDICRPLKAPVKFAKYSNGVTTIEYNGDEINLQTTDLERILEFLKQTHE